MVILRMASVRMSGALRDEILKGVDEKFRTADPRPTAKPELAQIVLDALREHPAYKAATEFLKDPAIVAMYNSARTSTLKAYIDSFRRTEIVKRINVLGFTFNGVATNFTAELPMPASMHFGAVYQASMDVHLDDFAPVQKQALIDAITKCTQETLDWDARYKDYTKAAKTLVDNCNTVGQFLAAWPEAETLLKQEVIQKLNEKTKSTRDLDAAAARAAFDAQAASPTLLVANIVGAANNSGDKT